MQSKKRTQFILLSFSIVFAAGLFLVLLFWQHRERLAEKSRLEGQDDAVGQVLINLNGKAYRLRDKLDTYLIIGVDKDSDRLEKLDPEAKLNNLQSDLLLLAVVNRAEETISLVQINRDSMAWIPRIGKEGAKLSPAYEQLALAHTYGSGGRDSCLNTAHAVSAFLYGIPIEHFFSLTMDAVPVLTDLAGGVPVLVEDDFSRVTDQLPIGQTVTLRGDLALTFVRGRMNVGDGSNLNRMNRQKVYLDALQLRLREMFDSSSGFAMKLASSLAPYTVSDLLTTELAREAERVQDYRFDGVEAIPGVAKVGEFMEFYPDEEELQQLLIRLLLEEVPESR